MAAYVWKERRKCVFLWGILIFAQGSVPSTGIRL